MLGYLQERPSTFTTAYNNMSPSLVQERVWNAFVKGYYHGMRTGQLSGTSSYEAYLSNYYEPNDAMPYMVGVIRTELPPGVEITGLADLVDLDSDSDELALLRDALMELSVQSRKASFRTLEELVTLCTNDAALYLAVARLDERLSVERDQVFSHGAYLITSSGRYLIGARRIRRRESLSTRPQTLIGILDLIGEAAATDQEYALLFENPFMIHAVERAWDDVEVLLQSGINLADKSLARLRWDLAKGLHDSIVGVYEAAEKPDEGAPKAMALAGLLSKVNDLGYEPSRDLASVFEFLENAREEAKLATSRAAEVETMIATFGKRRQRYLRKVLRQGKSHK